MAYSDPTGYTGEPDEEEELEVRPGPTYALQQYNNIRAQVDIEYPGGESRAIRIDENRGEHIFRQAAGHVPDTDLNRALIENTANNVRKSARN